MAIGRRTLQLVIALGVIAGVYFLVRVPDAELPETAVAERPEEVGEHVDAELEAGAGEGEAEATTRRKAESAPSGTAKRDATVLRVILDGVSEESASQASVTIREGEEWATWNCEGLTSEFDLDPFLDAVGLLVLADVTVEHPDRFSAIERISQVDGVPEDGRVVYEVRARLEEPVLWPQLTLSVRDAETREHLDDVTLSCVSTAFMALPMMPFEAGWFTPLGEDLQSPILLAGAHEAQDEEKRVAGFQRVSDVPRLFEFSKTGRVTPDRQMLVYVWAPGYAWSTIGIDVSKDTEREVLLEPGARLDVQVSNIQLERYAELEATAWLCVNWIRPEGGYSRLRWEKLETLDPEGLKLEGVPPGKYFVQVELRGQPWTKTNAVLGHEEISIAAGESREVNLNLDDAPTPFVTATLAGTVSFPEFGHEDQVELQFFKADTYKYVGEESRYQMESDASFSLAEMVPVGGDLPTWSFRLEGAPLGLYQVHLKPFLKSWMVELPEEGCEVDLVIDELAEVTVETVDAVTGERIPVDQLFFRPKEVHPQQAHRDRVAANLEEPGRFRFWTLPGGVSMWPYQIPEELDYGSRSERIELVAGHQLVKLELWKPCEIHFDFRDGYEPLPRWDDLWQEFYVGIISRVQPVDHEGEITAIGSFGRERRVSVSTPGIYEVRFDGVGEEHFHPIATQQVTVRPGEPAIVTVQLRRK